jgi:hypothetical protein
MNLWKRNQRSGGMFWGGLSGILFCSAIVLGGVLWMGGAQSRQPQDSAAASATAQEQAVRLRVGTYDSRAIAVAYGRSDFFTEKFKSLQRQHGEAQKSGDNKQIDQLKKQAESMQLRMHLQAFSDGPVDDVIAAVRDKLPVVAKQANVAAIVRAADHHDAISVELVDVTDELVALFNPDKQTLQVVKDVRHTKPTAIEEVARMPVVK